MIGNILITMFFLLAPAGVLWLCRKVPALDRIGPVLVLYLLGILVGNLFHPPGMAQIQEILSSAMVPLAIPLMLFSCTFRKSETRSQLLALLSGLLAVAVAVVAGYLLFGRNLEDGAKVGGMLTGVYTGGTINLASLQVMLDVPGETFVLLNSFDMAVSFLYLTFLLSFGIRLFRRWLPWEAETGSETGAEAALAAGKPFEGLFTRQGLRDAGVLLAVDALIIGISAGLGLLAGDGAFMTVLILSLTTLGIAASFWKPLKKRRHGYDIGMYCIYVFSVVVASMADLRNLSIGGSLNLLCYLTFVIFGSLILSVLLAKLLKIDADMMTVSSVAYICSPPFVPMISAAMKNRRVLAGGLAVGVVGYAAGNYLGFLMAQLLSLL
ncbi:MAG: DUF819 family protein [Bacteroidales bacterium]|nr:DUF819 family protein [Bacteroidales bacterium]